MVDPPQLGPFVLGDQLGAGGMGLVFHGRHARTDVPVALKVIRRSMGGEARQQFHREVQTHAGLVHPSVVYLYEYGDISEQAAVGVDDLEAGSPFVAMELADRGTLRDQMPVSSWPTVRRILNRVLDALACAHARDVIHRDLKPENLLVFDPGGGARLKLADFGIAHALGTEAERSTDKLASASGTPLYIAPEQADGRWRQYGPWTDLYALGCIVYELACGRPPFRGDGPLSIMRKHADADRPALEPQFPVPEGLEAWLHRVMAIDPKRRFRRAADANRALDALEEPADVGDEAPTLEGGPDESALRPTAPKQPTLRATRHDGQAPTVPLEGLGETRPGAPDTSDSDTDGPPEPSADRASVVSADGSVVPPAWETERTSDLPSQMVDTGLGLFGLRETPFVDRPPPEREHLWQALREVDETGHPRVVVLAGESGTGKSRLVDWLTTRAHELGAAHPMRAFHTASGETAGEGLGGMARRVVRGQKLDRGELYEHLLEVLPELDDASFDRQTDARALCELVFPTPRNARSVDGPRYQFSSPDQKSALVARWIRRYSRRPTVLWLDDLQWSELGPGLVEHLLASPFEQPPTLVAAPLRSDLLAEHPPLREHLDAIAEHERCTRLDLDPLGAEYHREFVGRLLPLDDTLHDTLADRTEGNPLFATQLLEHLVEQRLLEADPGGFQLPEGASLDLPGDIHELWMRRLARLVDDQPDDSGDIWRALERAAAMGREVDGDEWVAICREVGVERPDALREAAIARGLADRTDDGWTFAHGLLVDSLQRRAREEGRWQSHNRVCAELLADLYPDRPGRTAGRRADHHIEAGDLEAALEPLLVKSERLLQLGDNKRARQAIERRGQVLEALQVPRSDPRRLENDIRLVRRRIACGVDPGSQRDHIAALRDRAARQDRHALAAEAANITGWCAELTGDNEAARRAYGDAVEYSDQADDRRLELRCLRALGFFEFMNGQLDSAERHCRAAREILTDLDNVFRQINIERVLAWITMSRGNTDQAEEMFERALELAREGGYRGMETQCLTGLGDLARFEGDAERAQTYYRRCQRENRALNRPAGVTNSTMNLALVELMAGRFELADELLADGQRRLEEVGRMDRYRQLLRTAQLVHAAGTGDWSRFDELFEAYHDGWPEEAKLVKDHPWLLEMAGDYAAKAGQEERADRARELAGELSEELDRG